MIKTLVVYFAASIGTNLGKFTRHVKVNFGMAVIPQLLAGNVAQASRLQAGCLRYSTRDYK